MTRRRKIVIALAGMAAFGWGFVSSARPATVEARFDVAVASSSPEIRPRWPGSPGTVAILLRGDVPRTG